MSKSNRERWNKIATEKLKGRKILKVRYMKKEEADNWGVYESTISAFRRFNLFLSCREMMKVMMWGL